MKVTSGSTPGIADAVDQLYSPIIKPGTIEEGYLLISANR